MQLSCNIIPVYSRTNCKLKTIIGLGNIFWPAAASPLPKPVAAGGKQKKPRKLSACGAKAFVAFNSIVVLRYAVRGSFPEFLRPYGKNLLLSTYYSDGLAVNLTCPCLSITLRLALLPVKVLTASSTYLQIIEIETLSQLYGKKKGVHLTVAAPGTRHSSRKFPACAR